MKHANNNATKDIGINFIQLNLNNWSILILKKLHLINNINVKKTNAFSTIIIFESKKDHWVHQKKLLSQAPKFQKDVHIQLSKKLQI